MFSISKVEGLTQIEYKDKEANTYATIILEEGARLKDLTLAGKKIIANPDYAPYSSHYGGAILFPFVNRIKAGQYQFQGNSYQLDINDLEHGNAHHGLVYNKAFKLRAIKTDAEVKELKLEYRSTKDENSGFPFPYQIQLSYLFDKDGISLELSIKNMGKAHFPYAVGWHPYFLLEKGEVPELFMDVIAKAKIDEYGIATELEDFKVPKPFKIDHLNFDDCYQLASNIFYFRSKAYQIKFQTSYPKPFLQIYTPSSGNLVALEPATGLSNSFNHKIGRKTLNGFSKVQYSWSISLFSEAEM
jgi:aldose 1-epimerase